MEGRKTTGNLLLQYTLIDTEEENDTKVETRVWKEGRQLEKH